MGDTPVGFDAVVDSTKSGAMGRGQGDTEAPEAAPSGRRPRLRPAVLDVVAEAPASTPAHHLSGSSRAAGGQLVAGDHVAG